MGQNHPRQVLHALFEERARRTPGAVALLEGEKSISYSQLQARAEDYHRGLRARGVEPGSTVGLRLDRSIEWVACVLAVLKTGAAVVPLAPSNPLGWFREILTFARLDAVIDGAEPPLDRSHSKRIIRLNELASALGRELDSGSAEDSAGFPGHPDQPAFILSSSGSTGRPKMIVRSHRSFFHRLNWTWETHPYTTGEVCCQKSHMTTTHAVYELFEPLLGGAPVVIVSDEDVRALSVFWETIRTRGISRLLLVPSALKASLEMPGFSPLL